MHHGIETTLNDVISKFWIEIPDLPDYRVNTLHAFQCAGRNYAGPLFIKHNRDTTLKVYILPFTCGSSRALNLELTPAMKALAFISAFERFMARRGTLDVVISDNFKTFKSSVIKKFMLRLGVQQKFTLPASPWWGGFYE